MIKRAMTRVYGSKSKYYLSETTHDEIGAIVPTKEAKAYSLLMEKAMKEASRDIIGEEIPGEVEITIGKSWGG